jgi:hypothetical protein
MIDFICNHIGFFVFGGFLAFCFFLAWAAVRADNKDAEKHREFLSEILGREILNFGKWCEKQGIDKNKYWEDRTVNSAYRSYLIQAEQEASKRLK